MHAASASPHKVTLAEGTLEADFTCGESERLIRDRAYDSDPLDAALKERAYSAVMAATGLLYLAILTAFGTDLVARAVLAG